MIYHIRDSTLLKTKVNKLDTNLIRIGLSKHKIINNNKKITLLSYDTLGASFKINITT